MVYPGCAALEPTIETQPIIEPLTMNQRRLIEGIGLVLEKLGKLKIGYGLFPTRSPDLRAKMSLFVRDPI